MAYQPPYGYGGGSGSGNYPQYGQNQASNREAMLRALAQPDNPTYQYPTGKLQNVATTPGSGVKATDTALGIASQALPAVAGAAAGKSLASSLVGGGVGMGTGIGIGAEILGNYLKPKGQEATASPFADITDPYKRRLEGSGEGIAGGALKWGGRGAQYGSVVPGIGTAVGAGVGALAGAIGGAFTKNAKSAYSDFTTQDAVEAIKKMYQTRGGRLPTEQDIETILVGQGMDPTSAREHKGFVGEKGLYSVLSSLDKNFAAERQHLVDQAGGTGSAAGGTGSEPVAQLAGAAPTTPAPVSQTGPGTAGATNTPAPPVLGAGGTYHLPGTPGGAPGGIPPSTPPPQTSTSPVDPNAPPAPPAAPAPPTLPANADTDGYAAPAYTAAAASAAPPPGWDAKKWSDPAHQTPKYVVGRIMSQFAPTTENMPKVLAEIQKAYPGTTMIGKDTINIPGVGKTDILRGADVGGKGWQWLGEHAQHGGGTAAGGAGTSGAGYDASGDVSGSSDVIARIIANLGQLSGGQGAGGGPMTARDALLGQLGI